MPVFFLCCLCKEMQGQDVFDAGNRFFRCLVAAGMAYIRPEVVNEKGWVGQQVVQDLQFFDRLPLASSGLTSFSTASCGLP